MPAPPKDGCSTTHYANIHSVKFHLSFHIQHRKVRNSLAKKQIKNELHIDNGDNGLPPSVLQTAERNDIDSVGPAVGIGTDCRQDHEE